jgi:hypothetical protein
MTDSGAYLTSLPASIQAELVTIAREAIGMTEGESDASEHARRAAVAGRCGVEHRSAGPRNFGAKRHGG